MGKEHRLKPSQRVHLPFTGQDQRSWEAVERESWAGLGEGMDGGSRRLWGFLGISGPAQTSWGSVESLVPIPEGRSQVYHGPPMSLPEQSGPCSCAYTPDSSLPVLLMFTPSEWGLSLAEA